MERRAAKVNFGAAGGTAGRGAKTCKITLPISWLAELGIDEAHRQVEMGFDGRQISIGPYLSFDDYITEKKKQGHDMCVLRFYDGEQLCSTIAADYTEQTFRVRNEDVEFIKMAFGRRERLSWEDFEAFLEERCIPRTRGGLRHYLDAIGVLEYDPREIIKKTQGRMAEDQQWLEIEC